MTYDIRLPAGVAPIVEDRIAEQDNMMPALVHVALSRVPQYPGNRDKAVKPPKWPPAEVSDPAPRPILSPSPTIRSLLVLRRRLSLPGSPPPPRHLAIRRALVLASGALHPGDLADLAPSADSEVT